MHALRSAGLTTEEIRRLCQPSDARGALDVATSWGLVAGALAVAGAFPGPLTALGALVVLGGRQLGLAVLMHEAAHRMLFASPRVNDWVGRWLCGAPVWSALAPYRHHHLAHHTYTGTDRDPDRSLVTGFPTTRRSLARKLARDLSGVTGAKRVVGLLLMDLGFLEYTAAGDAKPSRVHRTTRERLALAAERAGPVVVTNALLAGVLATCGAAWLYGLWVLAWLTTYSAFLRVRSIAEHACTAWSPDPFANTRTTRAGWLARLTVAPHDVAYHLEHHLLMSAPHHRLPALRRELAARGVLAGTPSAASYREVLRIATTATAAS